MQRKLEEKNFKMFTPFEFQQLFGVSNFSTSKFLYHYTQKGLFIKLRNGLYCLSSTSPNSFVIANRLYQPSYISLETALSFYGIIPETVYEITSITTKSTRRFQAIEKEFSYTRIKKEFFIGYSFYQQDNEKFLIAEPEKALFDYLYMVSLKKRQLNNRINILKLRKNKVKQWQKLFNHLEINKIIDNLYAN